MAGAIGKLGGMAFEGGGAALRFAGRNPGITGAGIGAGFGAVTADTWGGAATGAAFYGGIGAGLGRYGGMAARRGGRLLGEFRRMNPGVGLGAGDLGVLGQQMMRGAGRQIRMDVGRGIKMGQTGMINAKNWWKGIKG